MQDAHTRVCVYVCLSVQVQNELLWSVRDMLRRELTNNQLKEMLELNNQSIPSGESNVSDCAGATVLCSCVVFGACL